jgi:RNA polymerase sigma-70 factor (ECF subfamily)
MNGERGGREALNELCALYREPVLAFFRSRLACREDAQDLTQRLFEHLLEIRVWKRADAAKGRFRSYILTIATNVLRNWNKTASAGKRDPGSALLSLEALNESGWEPAADGDEAAAFDREWARAALGAAWRRLVDAVAANPGKAGRFAVLRKYLPGSEAPPPYETAAASLGISVEHLKTLIYRLRSDFREALRSEVARTVPSGELDSEMDHLHAVMMAGCGGGESVVAENLLPQRAGGLLRGD